MYFNDLKIKKILKLILYFNIFILLGCTSDEDFDNSDFTSEVDNLLPDSNIIILAEKDSDPYYKILISSNGLQWSNIDLKDSNIILTNQPGFKNIIYSSQYVILTSTSVMNSKNGEKWNSFSMSSLSLQNFSQMTGIAYGNERYVIIHEGVYTDSPKIHLSSDLSNWNTYDGHQLNFLDGGKHADAIVYCNNFFWIFTSDRNFYKSSNGSSWTKASHNAYEQSIWKLSCFDDKLIISSDSNSGNTKSSTDGNSFNNFIDSNDINSKLKKIIYGNKLFMALNNNEIRISQNLHSSSWILSTGIDLSFGSGAAELNDIVFKNNIFLSTTSKGGIFYSTTGYSWTRNTDVFIDSSYNIKFVK